MVEAEASYLWSLQFNVEHSEHGPYQGKIKTRACNQLATVNISPKNESWISKVLGVKLRVKLGNVQQIYIESL